MSILFAHVAGMPLKVMANLLEAQIMERQNAIVAGVQQKNTECSLSLDLGSE